MPSDKIIAKIAESRGKSIKEVTEVVTSIFGLVVREMESGNRKPVRVHKLGIFAVKPERERKLRKHGLL